MDIEEENIELTPLEYARFHNLATNPFTFPLPLPVVKELQGEDAISLTDDQHLTPINFHVHVNTAELLETGPGGSLLLDEVREDHSSDVEFETRSLLDRRTAKQFRVELPLLMTDHDADVRAFATWEQLDGSLPHEPLDSEIDQGLEWPSKFKNLSVEIIDDCKRGKIMVSKEVLLYLHGTVADLWTEEDEILVWESAVLYKRNMILEPVTPPLMPSTPLAEPYILSSPACHLPLLSDPPSLIDDDLRAAETTIFESERLALPAEHEPSEPFSSDTVVDRLCVRPSDIFAPFTFSDHHYPSYQQHRIKVEDLKVEVPLTPQNCLPQESSTKSVKFSEYVEEFMLLDSYSPSTSFFSDAMMPIAMIAAAESIKRQSEQEQLQEADAKSRVKIPKMDFKLPDAPWKGLQDIHNDAIAVLTAQRQFLLRVKENYGFPPTWRQAKPLNHILSWVPFPAELGMVVLKEDFGKEHDLDSYLFDALPVNDSSSLTWKPPGLRILSNGDDEDDEDDLELGKFTENQPQDVSSLVRKRKMQFEDERIAIRKSLAASKDMEGAQLSDGMPINRNRKIISVSAELSLPTLEKNACHKLSKQTSSFLIGSGPFSAGSALDNFLEIRASKKQKPIDSSYFAGRESSRPTHGPHIQVEAEESPQVKPNEPTKASQNVLIAPLLNPTSEQLQCIISSTLMRHRAFIRTIQSLLPTLNLIERDFSAQNTIAWLGRGSISRSPIRSPLADEADLILSPSTAIMLSTLAQVRQKPLPGQKTKVAIQERVEKVSFRYENLLVLVSEGNTSAIETADGVDDQSTSALAEFAGFCAAIETPTLMYFVNGGEINLAKWTASVISQGSTLEAGVIAPLLAEETLWELFLRRVGLNAFAAQVVLAELKAPDGVDVVGSPSKAGMYGLTAFVEMGGKEREKRFGLVLGGTNVLKRVGSLMEVKWGG